MTEDIEILQSQIFWYKEAYQSLIMAIQENVDKERYEKIHKRHFEIFDAELYKVEDELD